MFRDAKPLDGLPAPYDLLGAVLQDGTQEWRDELDAKLNEDFVVWQPSLGLHSFGAIMLHIMWVEICWMEDFVQGLPISAEDWKMMMAGETDVDTWCWPNPPRRPVEWYFEAHDKIRSRIIEGLKNWPAPDALCGPPDDQRTPRWVFGHVIQHESYHGGQAVLLSRLWELAQK